MTPLQRAALARVPLTEAEVERHYRFWGTKAVNDLCTSHERLRAELQGAEVMLREAEEVGRLLWEHIDSEYGNGLRNGYWPGLKELWERGRKVFGKPSEGGQT